MGKALRCASANGDVAAPRSSQWARGAGPGRGGGARRWRRPRRAAPCGCGARPCPRGARGGPGPIPGPGPGPIPGGCSGVVLSRRPGLVLCPAAPFAPFLRGGPSAWRGSAALPAAALRARPRARVVVRGERGAPRELRARLLALVPCGAFRRALERGFGRAERWRFGDGEEDEDGGGDGDGAGRGAGAADPRALPWFAWLRVPALDEASGGWAARASAGCLRKGQALLACGSPFGALCPELFLDTLSRGVVSNLSGEGNALVLTDARCLPGTEGGAAWVPAPGGPRLVAVIAAALCWKGAEWVGLTLLCSLAAILRSSAAVLREAGVEVPPDPAWAAPGAGGAALGWAVLVECGAAWGSGVLLAPGVVLTCRHVVAAAEPLRVTPADCPGRDATALVGRVVFATEESSPFDVAVVELEQSVPGFLPPCLADTFLPGEEVSVVSFGALGRACGPSVTAGILSAVVRAEGHPVMLQTTCAVHGGSSGGPLVSSRSGCLLGIVASNTRDTSAGTTYPHLNFCIPITVLQPLMVRYLRTGDPDAFASLNRAGQGVRAAWRLQQQPGPPSKL